MVDLNTRTSARSSIYFPALESLSPPQSNTGSKTCLWLCITLITFVFMIMAFIVIAKTTQRRVMHSDTIIQVDEVKAWKKRIENVFNALGSL